MTLALARIAHADVLVERSAGAESCPDTASFADRIRDEGAALAMVKAAITVHFEPTASGYRASVGMANGTHRVLVGFLDPAGTPNGSDTGDAGLATDGAANGPICGAYSWAVDASSVPCEYFLPTGIPPHDDPKLDPKMWNVADVWIMTIDQAGGNTFNIGWYVGSAAACAGSDGWYYVDASVNADAGQTATRFAICPKSCTSVGGGALLRLQARSSVCQ